MAQTEGVKPKGQRNKKLMLVRYGRMGFLGWFEHNESKIPKVDSRVVIKTLRGLELGELVGQFNYRGGHFKSTPEQVEAYYKNASKDYPLAEGGTFVRFATDADLMEEKHLVASAKEEAKCCEKFIKEMELPMKVVDSEHLFGGERVVIYFSSNGRVDFRELVRRLAKEYQTRIELRQIGSRDEAKLISDFESCGQECCCRRFLKVLEPVNMRMAKLQKATLDPSKISGHCGRLKCCLRYEDETYRELKKGMPKRNARVKTVKGEGRVVAVHILTQLVVVQDEAGKREAYPVEEIEVLGGRTEVRSERSDSAADIVKEVAMVKEATPVAVETEQCEPHGQDATGGNDEPAKSEGPGNGNKNRRNRNGNRNRRNHNRSGNSSSNGGEGNGKRNSSNGGDNQQ